MAGQEVHWVTASGDFNASAKGNLQTQAQEVTGLLQLDCSNISWTVQPLQYVISLQPFVQYVRFSTFQIICPLASCADMHDQQCRALECLCRGSACIAAIGHSNPCADMHDFGCRAKQEGAVGTLQQLFP